MANLGFLGADGKIFHLSSSGTSTTGKRKKDEEELNVAQTVTTPTVAPTTEFEQTQENLKKADKKLEDTKKKYQQELSKAYQKNNVNFKTEFNRPTNMISYQTKEQDKIKRVPQNQSEGILNAREMVEPERQEMQQASNDWLYANYLNNVAKVGQEDTTMLDRLATPVRAMQDLVSPLTETGSNKYIDENGNVQFLPSYYSLKQEKVRNDTSGLGGLAMDIGYNASKIMGAGLVDKFTGGMGGKALYWTDMSVDNFQRAKNEGYDNKQAALNTIISTGSEYLTEKLLGGLAGKLTHGQASEVQNIFSNVVNKLIKNPKIANIVGSMGAEGLEEFTQEFIGAANDWITLGKTQDLGELIKNAFYSGLVGMGSAGISTGTSNAQGIITKENFNNMNNAITQLEQQRTNASKSEAKKIDTAISDAQNYVNKPFTQDYEKAAESVSNFLKATPQQNIQQETAPETTQTAQEAQNVEERPINQATQNESQMAKEAPIEQRENVSQTEATTNNGLTEKETNELSRRYKNLLEETGFDADYFNENATPEEMVGTLKTIKDFYEGDGFLEQARFESQEVRQNTRNQYNKINRFLNRFENKITQANQNIDNNVQAEYNESVNEKEGEANDLRTIQERGNSLSKEEHDALYGGDKSGIKGIRDNIKRVLQPRMESIIRSNNDSRKPLKNGFAEVNNNDFEQIFKANHPYLRNPDTVTPYGAEDYKNNKNYLSEDGLSGFSITQNGDLISVFNNSGKPGMLQRISDTVKSEAKTLDCFNSAQQDLPSLYQDAFGFKTAAIMDFNYDIMAEEHGKEYADAFVKKYGEAPVHFMVKSDQDVPVKHFNKDQYEEAMNYRDSFVGEGTSDSSFSNAKEENPNKEENVVDNKITADTLKKMSKDLTKELNESFKLKKGEAYSRTPQTAVKSMSVYEKAPSITDFDRKTVVHTIMSDEAAKIDAKARYEKNGSLEENAAYIRGLLQSDKRLTKNDKALAIYTMNEAYKQGNKAIGDGIVSDLTVLDVEAGQWAQASKLMKQMSPFGQLQTFVKMINNSVEKGNPRFKNVKITEEKINKVLDCYDKDGNWDADQFAKNMEEFKFDIQEQMTPTLMDKFNSVRMLGMLGSPRTHIRNMLGNVGNMGLRTAKNFNDRVMESVLIRNKEDRTRTFKPATKEVKDYVSNLTKEEILSGNKYDDTKTELERNMKVFNEHHKGMAKILNPISKGMNLLSDGNSWLLDIEDKLFSSYAYRRSLQEYLTAKGMQTVEDIEANPQVLADGKAFAMQQGLEATYRQDSELAAAISNYVKKSEGKNASKYTKFGGILVEANIPFKKTPINIAKTGIEFSPIGLTNGIYDTLVNVKSGKVEMSQAIDEISKGATGLALLGIGALLAHSGMELTAADDEKDKKAKFDKSLGEKEYAIKIGNRYYDLSWMAPASMPLYTGIELYQTLVNEKQFDGNAVVNALAKTIDPLSSMSLLEGLSKSVKSYSKTPGEFISKFTMSSLENYISQYVPTFLSQIANVSDDYKRTTTPSGKSSFTEFDKVWNNIKYKTPILRQTLPEQTDAWGRVQENDPLALRIFNSFFNPANNSLDKKDATDKELERLYKDLGEDNYYSSRSLPKVDFDKYLTFDKEKYKLSNAELTEFKKTYGKTAKDGVDKLVKTSEYKNATDEEKAKMLSSLYDYANQKAKEEYGKKHGLDYEDYKLDQLYSMVDAYNIPIEKAVSNKSIQQLTADGNFTAKQKKLLAVDDIDGLTSLQKDALKRKFTMFMGRPGYKDGEYALVDALDDSNVSEETKEDIKRFLSLG